MGLFPCSLPNSQQENVFVKSDQAGRIVIGASTMPRSRDCIIASPARARLNDQDTFAFARQQFPPLTTGFFLQFTAALVKLSPSVSRVTIRRLTRIEASSPGGRRD
jgi:hypothetical protein